MIIHFNSEKADSFREWDPIGNGDGLNLYCGSLFDDRGHTISGLYFNDGSKQCIGLFGCVFNFGKTTFKNINIADSYFYGHYFVGSICGQAYSTTEIVNCSNSGRVTAGSDCGGICGEKLRVSKNGNIYDVFLDGVIPQDFSKMYKFTSSDGDTFTYSVFSYIKENLNSEKKSLTNLLNSMYEYNQAADAYLD